MTIAAQFIGGSPAGRSPCPVYQQLPAPMVAVICSRVIYTSFFCSETNPRGPSRGKQLAQEEARNIGHSVLRGVSCGEKCTHRWQRDCYVIASSVTSIAS